MDFGSFIDGIKVVRRYEKMPKSVIDQEIKFYSDKVKSVNTFNNFSEYSIEERVHKMLSYISSQLKVELDLNDPVILYQCIRFFLAQCLRGEYYIDFSGGNKTRIEDLYIDQHSLGKFICLSNQDALVSVKSKSDSILLGVVNYIERKVKNGLNTKSNKVTFQGSYQEFSNKFDKLIRANRIGAISIYYDTDSHNLIKEILELAKKRKSFFCNVAILFNVEDMNQLVNLSSYCSNYVKILKINQSLILNTQLG